jgi:hypothetical protein
VRLTPRQHAALRAYAGSLGLPVGTYVREQLVGYIPSQYWGREEAPPGQLVIEVGEEA